MKVEIGFYDKYPMERRDKYVRYEAYLLVLEGDDDISNHEHKLNKKVIRKNRNHAYLIAKKWHDESVKKGWKVRPMLGCSF